MTAPTYELISDDWGVGHCYWTQGTQSAGYRVNEITNPPVTGWSLVLVKDGEKHCTIFCPFTFSSFQVSHRSAEYVSLRKSLHPYTISAVKRQLLYKWEFWTKLGDRVDFGTAALILRSLSVDPPAIAAPEVEYDDFGDPVIKETEGGRKGKPLEESLKKPVKKTSKRGKVLEWFLSEGGGPKSIQACMAAFGITRSNALSHLFMLNKDHGIGYALGGNTATVFVPGQVDPFE